MAWQDVRTSYCEPPDRLDEIDKMLEPDLCEFDLSECPCETCGDNSKRECFFISDGGFESRDGTYLCRKCARELFDA